LTETRLLFYFLRK